MDIVASAVHEGLLDVEAGTIRPTDCWSFAQSVGAVAVAAGGDLLVAERETLTRVHPDRTRTPVARVLAPARRASRRDSLRRRVGSGHRLQRGVLRRRRHRPARRSGR
ncbi:hypothetical protein [Actinoplanes sp. ATCC 53533]|uniref:hypothetical protein n=1 Tax=Actinoplanes sp. ATCC 53533 TaxID=1288362 RepID=UPI001F20D859|nr:hypothetical protein [Actinoplanes sp. ATCC 53533]